MTARRSPIPALVLAAVMLILLLWVGSLVRAAAVEMQDTYEMGE